MVRRQKRLSISLTGRKIVHKDICLCGWGCRSTVNSINGYYYWQPMHSMLRSSTPSVAAAASGDWLRR
jgi:hypothetical protein